jgi:hypothetical protein
MFGTPGRSQGARRGERRYNYSVTMIPLSYLSPKTEVRESVIGGSISPKTILTIAEGADIRRASRTPTR